MYKSNKKSKEIIYNGIKYRDICKSSEFDEFKEEIRGEMCEDKKICMIRVKESLFEVDNLIRDVEDRMNMLTSTIFPILIFYGSVLFGWLAGVYTTLNINIYISLLVIFVASIIVACIFSSEQGKKIKALIKEKKFYQYIYKSLLEIANEIE